MAVLIGVCLIAPAMAGTSYQLGTPNLSAHVSGANEFGAGQDIQLVIVVDNSGISQYKFVQPGLTDRDDQPTTAKFLSAALSAGNAPLTIRTDPQMLGDLKSSASAPAIFSAKVSPDAAAGTYQLPLALNYTYFDTAEQYGVDTIQYYYKSGNETILIPVTIKPEVSIGVLSAEPEHLIIGSDGYINITIKNTGSEDGTSAIVRLSRNGNSPVIPVDNSIYVGDFPSGSTVSCRYKVSVSGTAEPQTYPVDVAAVYLNQDGDTVTSRSETVGIPVGEKVNFTIISPPAEMNPGNRKAVEVEYRNDGNTSVYSAQARLSTVDPFTSSDDIAYIGDLAPGEFRKVSFVVSADRTATMKDYGLDSEIRYRDSLDNTYISDPLKVEIRVVPSAGLNIVLSNPVYLSVIFAGVIGLLYLIFHFRADKRK